MRKEYEQELKKIVRVSNALLPILYLTLVSVAVTMIWVVYGALTSPTASGEPFFGATWRLYLTPHDLRAGLLTYADKVKLVAVSAVLTTLLVPGLWFATRLVKSFKQGKLFSARSVRYARTIALLYLVYIVLGTVASIVMSWTPGGFDMVFNPVLFSRDFILLGLIWLFVWIHQLGTALHDESEMTI